ncbi:MAG: ferredoxin family protein [Chloroflexota bacterium]
MPHIVTRLCLRDTACLEVCPVECMVLGKPEDEWPWLYIDPDTCIDCGACVPECPYEAIFPEEEVPFDFEVQDTHDGGTWVAHLKEVYPDGEQLAGVEIGGQTVHVLNAKKIEPGVVLDLTEDIEPNYNFFEEGPGYDALD